jgi:putative ABC transport system permease protein
MFSPPGNSKLNEDLPVELCIILKSLRRNKIGAVVIAVQIGVTLAILSNALFIIQQRLADTHRPSGVDEANIFMLRNQWVGEPKDLPARLRTDLDTLRGLGGVVDAYASNSVPLSNGGDSEGLGRNPDDVEATALTAVYYGDEHALATLGVKLIAGRNFQSDEIIARDSYNQHIPPSAVIITRALAEKLFPHESPLGKPVYISFDKHAVPVVGVIDRLQVPWSTGWGSEFFYNSILMPYRWSVLYTTYVIRTKPGQLAAVMKTVQKTLIDLDRQRVLTKVEPLSVARVDSYKDSHGLAVILETVCVALLLVTGFGIVGLTSYWVAQRRRQIGIRRALGASRQAIVRYFQAENLLIAASGTVLGVILAIAANLWMVTSFEMQRLNPAYALAGALAVLGLGQLAVLWPALRAASIPPALATRGV